MKGQCECVREKGWAETFMLQKRKERQIEVFAKGILHPNMKNNHLLTFFGLLAIV